MDEPSNARNETRQRLLPYRIVHDKWWVRATTALVVVLPIIHIIGQVNHLNLTLNAVEAVGLLVGVVLGWASLTEAYAMDGNISWRRWPLCFLKASFLISLPVLLGDPGTVVMAST